MSIVKKADEPDIETYDDDGKHDEILEDTTELNNEVLLEREETRQSRALSNTVDKPSSNRGEE